MVLRLPAARVAWLGEIVDKWTDGCVPPTYIGYTGRTHMRMYVGAYVGTLYMCSAILSTKHHQNVNVTNYFMPPLFWYICVRLVFPLFSPHSTYSFSPSQCIPYIIRHSCLVVRSRRGLRGEVRTYLLVSIVCRYCAVQCHTTYASKEVTIAKVTVAKNWRTTTIPT